MQVWQQALQLWQDVKDFFLGAPTFCLWAAAVLAFLYAESKHEFWLIFSIIAAVVYYFGTGDPDAIQRAVGAVVAGLVVGGVLRAIVAKVGWLWFAAVGGAVYYFYIGQENGAQAVVACVVALAGLRWILRGAGDPLGVLFNLGCSKKGGDH